MTQSYVLVLQVCGVLKQQKPWVESGGLSCQYVERLWNQDDIAEERRSSAVELVKSSIDMGIAVIGWDIGLPEWGLIIGYDDQLQKLAVLDVAGRRTNGL